MRINKLIAQSTGLSRRGADKAIENGRVTINGMAAEPGQSVSETDLVYLDDRPLKKLGELTSIMLNKPIGYVTSRAGQGSKTIYSLLPSKLHSLKPVGRLDKESSGLILLTDDGELAYNLTHPKFEKIKTYLVELSRPLDKIDEKKIGDGSILLDEKPSKLGLKPLSPDRISWEINMSEGRNRQIRRTFRVVGYEIKDLHRISFGDYKLDDLAEGEYRLLEK